MTIALDQPPVAGGIALRDFAKTMAGRLTLVTVFTAMLGGLKCHLWWAIGICLALISIVPRHRRRILLLAGIAWAVLDPPVHLEALGRLAAAHDAAAWMRYWPIGVVAVWLFAWTSLWAIRRWPRSLIARRPVMSLIGILLAALAVARSPITGLPWIVMASFAMALASYIWFLAYWLTENATAAKASPLPRMGFWRPFWGFTTVPFGKGAAYLERCEAKDNEQFAVAQLKGLRLLAWAGLLTVVLVLVNRYLFGLSERLTSMPENAANGLIPTYWMALAAQASGHPVIWPLRWLALIMFFLLHALRLAVFGHTVIACCRMAGFNVFRNTYRPFTATSIAEGYNRVYWYFKELLVTFFFYPTFLRHFKRWPRVRIFMATLAAAGLGNFLFHYLKDYKAILTLGWRGSLELYASYAAYALLLGAAIGLSQLRIMRRGHRPPIGWRKWRAIAAVITFYVLIAVYLEPNPDFGLRDYGLYLVNLFRL